VLERLHELASGAGTRRVSDDILRQGLHSRQQVVVDSFLASNVYSPWSFRQGTTSQSSDDQVEDDLETMSLAAEAMSLTDSGPSTFCFDFLRPLSSHAGPSRAKPSDLSPDHAGVDLLLSEWPADADIEDYRYIDPYDRSVDVTLQGTFKNKAAYKSTAVPTAFEHTRQPPTITIQKDPPQIRARAPMPPPSAQLLPVLRFASSQPLDSFKNRASSQDIMPSTQIVPGPHGSRSGIAKKKKRVGGF
jgi:hypothetical protein